MKILILTTGFPRFKGDYHGIMIYNFARGLIKNNTKVGIIAPNFAGGKHYEMLDGNIEVFRFSYFWPYKFQKLAYGDGIPTNLKNILIAKLQLPFFLFFFFIKALLNANKYDMIHSQWIYNGIIGLLVSKLKGKKSLLTVRRCVFNGSLQRFLAKYILKMHDFVVFNSTYTKEKSFELGPIKNSSIISSSVDIQKFNPDAKGILRDKYRIPPNKKIILTAGYLIEKKGIEYLMKSFKKVIEQLDSYLVIIGTGYLEDRLKSLSDELNLSGRVIFCGRVFHSDMPSYFVDSDVFVLPSIVDRHGETETLGMVLVEAMACGLPVIGSDVGGIPYSITDDFGYLVPQKDTEKLYRTICKILSEEYKCKEMGQKAREYVLKKFSNKIVTEKYIEIYRGLIQ